MAEFVSAIVGLLVAGAKVGDSLYALIDTLKDAPNEFLALSNEVTDFRVTLSRVIEARESGELALEENGPDSGLDGVVERGKNTPMETMIDDTLVSLAMGTRCFRGHDPSNFQQISQLFGKSSYDLLDDYAEDQGFTVLHEVLLGMRYDHGTLDEYLASFGEVKLPTELIDATDACGRTALTWAVEYGWTDAVTTLLKYGSNPHQLRHSIHGKSPLLHLVIAGPASQRSDAGFLGVIRALLEAGVDVNAVDHEGWSPLHVAASWNHYDVIKELAAFSVGALDWDALTDDKQSATDLSLGGGFNAEVQQLLQNHGLSKDNPIETEEKNECSSDSDSGDDERTLYLMEDKIDSPLEQFYDVKEIS
ncbi:hypothetical protein H2199_005340 [Coniosporium tulheliwenetii]|uniref:Uncharacterized protein n=1 Tax=Coniosporium tulheliwenetii TaxID=3383036 RepID=A0ACC2Z1Z5_9PEZI|nr:hypothetical protein H2199_005340 [Cladosporium sp. JES 115]